MITLLWHLMSPPLYLFVWYLVFLIFSFHMELYFILFATFCPIIEAMVLFCQQRSLVQHYNWLYTCYSNKFLSIQFNRYQKCNMFWYCTPFFSLFYTFQEKYREVRDIDFHIAHLLSCKQNKMKPIFWSRSELVKPIEKKPKTNKPKSIKQLTKQSECFID